MLTQRHSGGAPEVESAGERADRAVGFLAFTAAPDGHETVSLTAVKSTPSRRSSRMYLVHVVHVTRAMRS